MGATSGLFLHDWLTDGEVGEQSDLCGHRAVLVEELRRDMLHPSRLSAHRTPHWIALSQGSSGHVTQRQRRGGVGAGAGEERAGCSYLRVLLGHGNDANVVLNCLKQLSPIRKTKSSGKCLGSTMNK